jgi:uncharacterized protein (DUF3084 family)
MNLYEPENITARAVSSAQETPSNPQVLDLQKQIEKLEAENRVLVASRNAFQHDAYQMKNQAIYGKRRYEKAEREVAMWYQKAAEYERRINYMEADLAMR